MACVSRQGHQCCPVSMECSWSSTGVGEQWFSFESDRTCETNMTVGSRSCGEKHTQPTSKQTQQLTKQHVCTYLLNSLHLVLSAHFNRSESTVGLSDIVTGFNKEEFFYDLYFQQRFSSWSQQQDNSFYCLSFVPIIKAWLKVVWLDKFSFTFIGSCDSVERSS